MADTNPNQNRMITFIRDVFETIAGPIVLEYRLSSTLDDVEAACKTSKPGDAQQVKYFWNGFNSTLQSQKFRDLLGGKDGFAKYALVPWMKMAASGKAEDEQAWKAGAVVAKRVLFNASLYQLKLIRAFFPGPPPLEFAPSQVEVAFRDLALGTWSPGAESDESRMDDITSWMHWAAFIDTVLEAPDLGISDVDRDAWRKLQPMVLYGVLLHAHYDSRGGSQLRPSLQPAGLASTSKEDIRAFAFEPRVDTRNILIRINNEINRSGP